MNSQSDFKKICEDVRRQVLEIHFKLPETRLASALSAIEIFVALYYGDVLNISPQNLNSPKRDRLILGKAHGAIPLYPILADLGFFSSSMLTSLGEEGTTYSMIPDPGTPGIETVNGSLGHGPGVAAGICLGLKKQAIDSSAFVLLGDGELSEGSIWETASFAAIHELDNLNLVIDCNKKSMFSFCCKYFGMSTLIDKFVAFGWDVVEVDGHDTQQLVSVLRKYKFKRERKPKVIIAHTKKGHGIKKLENDEICHILAVNRSDIASEDT